MNTFIISFFSILFIILGIATIENKCKRLKKILVSVNKAYFELINSQGKNIKRILFIPMIILNVVMILIISYAKVVGETGKIFNLKIIILTLILGLFVFITVYFLFGIPLMVMFKISKLINLIKNSKLSFKFLISWSIITIYSFFLWIANGQMIKLKLIVFIGLTISYILNIEILINIIMNPLCMFTDKNESLKMDVSRKQMIKITLLGAILLLIIIVINLFLGVLMISYSYGDAYYCSIPNHEIKTFDLFYYVIISFTTIGYGDIVPKIFESQVMSVIIAFTSVLCLVIFVSSVLSVKDELKN